MEKIGILIYRILDETDDTVLQDMVCDFSQRNSANIRQVRSHVVDIDESYYDSVYDDIVGVME